MADRRTDGNPPMPADPWSDAAPVGRGRRLAEAAVDALRWLAEIGRPRAATVRRRIREALDAGDAAALEAVGRAAAGRVWSEGERLRIAHVLAHAGRSDLGLAVILAGRHTTRAPGVVRVLTVLRRNARDPALKATLAEAIDRRTKGGRRLGRARSPLAFPAADRRITTPGRTVFVAAPGLPGRHAAAFEAATAAFRDRIAQPPRGRVVVHHDVYITRSGLIFDRDGRIIRAAATAIPSFDPAAVPAVDDALDLVMGPNAGIYHWLVDRVPLLAVLRSPKAAGVRVLLADDAPSFETGTMAMLGLADRVLPVGDVLFVRRLHQASIGLAGMMRFGAVAPVIEALVRAADAAATRDGLERPARLYVSRRDAARRPLVNEAAVEAAMRARGFTVVQFARIPLAHQIALAASAEVVAGPHGAGLAHLMFARPGCRVVELVSLTEGYYGLRSAYARLAVVRGLDHLAWGEPEPPDDPAWRVDLAGLLPRLDAFLAGPAPAAETAVSRAAPA